MDVIRVPLVIVRAVTYNFLIISFSLWVRVADDDVDDEFLFLNCSRTLVSSGAVMNCYCLWSKVV